MSTLGTAPRKLVKFVSVRRHVNRRIVRFSLLIGAAATLLVIVSFFASVYPALEKSQEINKRTMSEINCTPTGCDTSSLSTDWALSDADYVVDTQTRSVLAVPGSEIENAERYRPPDYSDTEFITRFRQPTTYAAPNGEVWRLYSESTTVGDKKFEIMIGFKRGISDSKLSKSDDEILESIAAFANTNDGVIFIGIDDSGRIKGLVRDSKQKDLLEQKLRQLVRNRIKPMPPMQIAFEDIRGLAVAKVTIARGDAPIYMLDGRIYIRSGSLDLQAQPEDVSRLFAS